jgi:hypothetical protein
MRQTFVLWLALVVGIVGFSDRASADWQGTVWGMTREEANKGFRIPHRDGEEFNPYTYTNFDSYTTDDLTFGSGALVFLRDRLARITMNLTNAGQCDSLLETLRRIYGKPASDGKKPILGYFVEHIVTWDDAGNDNKITLKHYYISESVCRVVFEPLEPSPPIKLTPAPGGL